MARCRFYNGCRLSALLVTRKPPTKSAAEASRHRADEVFAGFPEIRQVILYGSRAKGNFKRGSDSDLCLVGDGLSMPALLKIDTALDDLLLPYKIDLSIRAHIDNTELPSHINRVGTDIYRRSNKE